MPALLKILDRKGLGRTEIEYIATEALRDPADKAIGMERIRLQNCS